MKTALLLQYMIRNDEAFESTSRFLCNQDGRPRCYAISWGMFICLSRRYVLANASHPHIDGPNQQRFLLPSRVIPKERFSFPNGVHSDEIFFVPRFSYPQ